MTIGFRQNLMATLPFSCKVEKEVAVSPIHIQVNPISYSPKAQVVSPGALDLKVKHAVYKVSTNA